MSWLLQFLVTLDPQESVLILPNTLRKRYKHAFLYAHVLQSWNLGLRMHMRARVHRHRKCRAILQVADFPCAPGVFADYYYNNGCSEAVIYSTLDSATPGVQVTS